MVHACAVALRLARAIGATVLLALIATVVAVAASPPLTPPGFPAATVKIASGSWSGTDWTLYAGEARTATSFAHCIGVEVGSLSKGDGCGGGGLRSPGELLPTSPPAPGFGYGIDYEGQNDCPAFANVLAGLVVADARQVVFTLAGGKTVTTPTIPSPRGMAQSLRFWAIHVPCGTSVSALVARDAHGKIVARADSRFLPRLG